MERSNRSLDVRLWIWNRDSTGNCIHIDLGSCANTRIVGNY